jgi:hypothetical protein
MWLADVCVLGQWRAARLAGTQPTALGSDVTAIQRAVAALRDAPVPRIPVPVSAGPRVCAALVDATLAVALRAPDARTRVERVDALPFAGPALDDASTYIAVAVARLFERLGDPRRALAAVRRRSYLKGWPRYLSTTTREEGRLALVMGDTAGARAAFDWYLTFRADPEEAVRPVVDAVRAMASGMRATRPAPRMAPRDEE